jgi:hypothetical protein
MHPLIPLMSANAQQKSAVIISNHHRVMTTEQTCQRRAAGEVQFLQIDASFNSINVWNAQQKVSDHHRGDDRS